VYREKEGGLSKNQQRPLGKEKRVSTRAKSGKGGGSQEGSLPSKKRRGATSLRLGRKGDKELNLEGWKRGKKNPSERRHEVSSPTMGGKGLRLIPRREKRESTKFL